MRSACVAALLCLLAGGALGEDSIGIKARVTGTSFRKDHDYDSAVDLGEKAEKAQKSIEEELEPEIDMFYGYMWILFICYMFFAQEHVCEAYFVAAIDVCVAKFRAAGSPWGEESVAGATLCALGCNGPELFTNLIACCIMGGSDVGVGTIVGSEVFNLLVIVGGTILAAPVLPMGVDKVSFTRDSLFYALSIVLLYWTLLDGVVKTYEACTLFSCAILYTATVYFTSSITKCLGIAQVEEEAADAGGVKLKGVEVEIKVLRHNRMGDSKDAGHTIVREVHVTNEGVGFGSQSDTSTSTGPVTADMFSAMPINTKSSRRASSNPVGQSTHFSLNQPLVEGGDDAVLPYQDIKEIVDLGSGFFLLHFRSGVSWAETTLKVRCSSPEKAQELLTKFQALSQAWMHPYDGSGGGAIKHWLHILKDKKHTCGDKIKETLKLPVEFMLAFTLSCVDVKDLPKADRWVGCFCGAMCWLGCFSYLMVEAAGAIRYYFGVPESVLGITLCALGTSFPNAVASVIMASEGKTDRALANALGSNVQNVFLALAFPWVLVTVFPILTDEWFQDFEMASPGIKEGVLWMLGTLGIVIALLILGCGKLGKGAGYFLISLYIVYIVVAVAEALGLMGPLA